MRILKLFIVLILVLGISWISSQFYKARQTLAEIKSQTVSYQEAIRKKTEEVVPEFLANEVFLSEKLTLFKTGNTKDAGPSLNPCWVGDKPSSSCHNIMKFDSDAASFLHEILELVQRQIPLHRILEMLKESKQNFGTASRYTYDVHGFKMADQNVDAQIALVKKLDFSWMKSLNNYDYWDLTGSENSKSDERIDPEHLTREMQNFPLRFDDLYYAALARCISVLILADGAPTETLTVDLNSAIQESLQLAKLSYSTENIPGAITTWQLLKMVGAFVRYAEHEGVKITPVDGLLTDDEYDKTKLVFSKFHFLTSSAQGNETVRSALKGKFGACEAVKHASAVYLLVRSMAGENYRPEYAEILQSSLKEHTECRLTTIKDAWNAPYKPIPFSSEPIAKSENLSDGFVGKYEWVKFPLADFIVASFANAEGQ